MTCPSCGKPLVPGVTSCPSCGAAVTPSGSLPKTSLSHRSLRQVPFRDEKLVSPVRVNDVLAGRYRLEEQVGEGGMGAVFVAHDMELDRKVAVKLLAASLVHDDDVQERFDREARLTAKLDHPNIVPIYDVGRHEGRPFIVMKLLQGDTLAGLLRARGGFTTDETLRLVRQLAAGLDYIHAQGFIHRDVKAGNIFVAPDGHATILDFGILRAKGSGNGITRTGMVMGTPHYMAPEQALGLKDVDHRVDLYALAVVLFECLSGTLPFEAESELQLIHLQAHAPPPDIVDRAPWIPRPVADVVRRALAKDPTERFHSGAELVAALDGAWGQHRASQSNLPPVPAVATPARSPVSRRNMQSVSALRPVPLEPDTHELAQALRRGRRPAAFLLGLLLVAAGGLGWWFLAGPGAAHPVVETPSLDAGLALASPDAAVDEAGDAGEAVDAGALPAVVEADDAGAPDAGEVADAGAPAEVADAGAAVEPGPTDPRRPTRRKGKVNVLTTNRGEPWWAQVSVDGVAKGRTPLLLELPAGRHVVRVERAGFRPQQRVVTVVAGKSVVVKLELVP